MATVILSRGALSIVAKEYYQKLDKAQEKLFAYIYHLDKGDEEQARQAFNEFIETATWRQKHAKSFYKNTEIGSNGKPIHGEKQHENKIHRL